MKNIIKKKLKLLAKLILRRYKPKVIGITGSVGKTSTKEAVYYLLSKHFSVRTNPKNYNNEFGLPLTIIGSLSPGKSIIAWLKIFFKAILLIIIKNKKYPKILILEMGIDRPGDMDYLTSIVKPDISIVTAVGHAHIAYFDNLENIKKEKQVIVEKTKNNGLIILNNDNYLVREMIKVSKTSVLTYGFKKGADLFVSDLIFKELLFGLNCKFNYNGSVVPAKFNKIINEVGIYAIMPSVLVGLHFKLNLVQIISSFQDFSLPAGRLNVIKGINDSIIIDDSYNASPESTSFAIKTLARFKNKGKKYVVLGDMLEIGDYSQKSHQLIGEQISKYKINYLITKGDLASYVNKGAIEAGLNKKNSFTFSEFSEIINYLKNNLKTDDIILIKGSQGSRMEKIIKGIMAEPDMAEKLLVRQELSWS